jgi:hypothetical protein
MNRRARFPATQRVGALRIASAVDAARPAPGATLEDSRIQGFEDQGLAISDQ